MNRIKVLHIIKSLGRGGAEMLLPETLKLHDQNKFEFHYIYFLPWKNQMAEALETAGGRVHCFSASNNVLIILKTFQVIRYIKKHNIQLIHCHLPWAGFLGRLIFKIINIPVIYTEHNKQERYHGITFRCNKLSFNWQSLVIAVSDDVADSIKKNIAPTIPVHTVLNGVNTNSFQRDIEAGVMVRNQYNIPHDALVVGTVAVFRFQKRLAEWLEIMAAVCSQNSNVYGIIVGDGPLKNELEKKLESLQLNGKVIMAGLQTDVKPWLSAMDIYMMSSVFEGLPIALLEAMSMGCAIASTRAGGIGEVVQSDVDGLLVDVDNPHELTRCINQLKDNKQLRESLAQNARKRVINSFSMERMVTALENVYKIVR